MLATRHEGLLIVHIATKLPEHLEHKQNAILLNHTKNERNAKKRNATLSYSASLAISPKQTGASTTVTHIWTEIINKHTGEEYRSNNNYMLHKHK